MMMRYMILDVHALDRGCGRMRENCGQEEYSDCAAGGDCPGNRSAPRRAWFEKPYRHRDIDRPEHIRKEHVGDRQDMGGRVLPGQTSPQKALDQLLHAEDHRNGSIGYLAPFVG